MTTEVRQVVRPKQRRPIWGCRVTDGGEIVFDSAWVSLRFLSSGDATWLAELVQALHSRGAFAGTPGHRPHGVDDLRWDGDVADNWMVKIDGLYAHAEHLDGPMRGGIWYCSVSRGGKFLFHTAHSGVQPRDGEAARWVCELIIRAVAAGIWSENQFVQELS